MEPANGHVVLDSGDDGGFTTLRREARPRAERYEIGRSLRERAHRADIAFWRPPDDRADPVQQVIEQNAGRHELRGVHFDCQSSPACPPDEGECLRDELIGQTGAGHSCAQSRRTRA